MRNIAVVPILNGNVVQTTAFGSPRYIGEPTNIVKQLSDMGADEIFVIDIGYSRRYYKNRNRQLKELEQIANQAFCPIGYGGGLYLDEHVDIAIEIVKRGYEKIIAASAWWRNHTFYAKLSDRIGKQSVVKCLEREYDEDDYSYITDTIEKEQDFGELLLIDTERNGKLLGLNPDLCDIARRSTIPTVVCGGYQGETLDVDTAASTYYMLYKGEVMLNYERNHNTTL